MRLKEYHFSQDPSHHWNQRKRERVDELFDVELPDAFYTPEDNREEVKAKLLTAIKQGLDKRISLFIHESDVEPEKYNVTVVAIVELLRNGKVYKPILRATSVTGEDTSENAGNTYIAITRNDVLYTLMLVPEAAADKEKLVRKAIWHAQKTKGEIITYDDVAIRVAPTANFKLSADHTLKAKSNEPVGRPTSPSELPYKVRGDYKKHSPGRPSFLDHDKFGRGEIVASDPGMMSTGVWDSVTVKFPGHPDLKTFKKLYTTTYFRSLQKTESYIRALEKLTGKKIVLQ